MSLVTNHGRATPLLWLTVLKDELKDQRNDFEDLCLARLVGVRINQPHGRFEMRQIGAMLIHLTLKTFGRFDDFQSLVPQGRDNQRAHRGSHAPRIMTSGEHRGSSLAPVEGAGGGCYRRPHL